MDKQKCMGAQKKTVILVCKFLFRMRILFAPVCFYLSIEAQFLRFFYSHIFTDKKFSSVIIPLIISFFFVISVRLVFLPVALASLPPGVMLLSYSTTPRDIATDVEKTSQKDPPERERPNGSVVKIRLQPCTAVFRNA